jgi:hypothetical protein
MIVGMGAYPKKSHQLRKSIWEDKENTEALLPNAQG